MYSMAWSNLHYARTAVVAALDANGWAVVIGAVGIVVVQVVTQVLTYLHNRTAAIAAMAASVKVAEQVESVTETLKQNTDTTNTIADMTTELEKQGNSRWDEVKRELTAARSELKEARTEIKALQQLRVDDAKGVA